MDEFDMRLSDFTSRQSLLIPTENIASVTVAILGVGGIGSNVAMTLASLGVSNFMLVDKDVVGGENIFPGHFPVSHIDMPKVYSIKDQLVSTFGIPDDRIVTHFGDIEDAEVKHDIVVIGTDTLPSRRRAYSRNNGRCHYWIDGRMGATLCSVYVVPRHNQQRRDAYEESMRGRGSTLPCGQKATSPITKGMIPAMIGQAIYDIVNDKEPPYWQLYDLRTNALIAVKNP